MDSFCIKAGIHWIGPPIAVVGLGSLDVRSCHSPHFACAAASVGRNSSSISLENQPGQSWGISFRQPLRYLWLNNGVKNRHDPTLAVDGSVSVEEDKAEEKEVIKDNENVVRNDNWVLKILHVRSLWKEEVTQDKRVEDLKETNGNSNDEGEGGMEDGEKEECEACSVCDDGENIGFDRDSFSKMLRKVSLPEARLYSQLSYLSNLAYSIPKIKPANLLRSHGLRFVTSSVKKKEKAQMDDLGKASSEGVVNGEIEIPENCEDMEKKSALNEEDRETLAVEEEQIHVLGHRISAAAAYQIAASAAAYLHTHTKSILPLVFSKSRQSEVSSDGKHVEKGSPDITNKEKTSLMATTDSVTAVVAAKEEVKQAVADDLNSVHSSPCQWFACDDEQSGTRFFVIQGSESLASWQANLLFEPVPFEGFDVLVHRGIYEVAKGIYQQMLPEVHEHLKSVGSNATFRFTGHSLGGSLSLLINLMLLIRGEVPSSSLLPVITFGAPTVMCGGNQLLQMLGLPKSHLKSITLHRDIVPRAFSCHYPNHIAEFLKVVNGSFRTLPCLNNQKLLYAPMGDFIILQPDDNFSPSHDLLPSGSGLYLLSSFDDDDPNKQIDAALSVFLNSPHPLEILSDRGAFGAGGHILRDHDMNSYFKSVRNVIRKELNRLRKERRQARRHRVWWPLNLLASDGGGDGRYLVSVNVIPEQVNVYGMLQSGKESLKRFGQVITSKNIHLLVVILAPIRLLILGTSRILR